MTRPLVSLREASRQLGIRLSTLQHHIKRGQVTPINGKIDVEVARIQLDRNKDHLQAQRARSHLPPRAELAPALPAAASEDLTSWMERKTRADALRAELELRLRSGELVEVAAVDRATGKFLADLSTRMDTIPDRIAAEWGGDQKLRRRLQEEIRRVRTEAIHAAREREPAAA